MSLLTKFINCGFAHSSKAWFKQHVNDQFVKKANDQNYRSRAAFKLEQIQQKYKILGDKIIDLGSAPGSWSEFALRYKKSANTPKVNVVSVDILDMKPIEGVDFYKCDARDRNLHKMLKEKYGYFDSIISDMAPNFSGVAFETHEEILGLNKMCVKLALELSHQNCSLVMKTTQGSQSKVFVQFLELLFESTNRFKPKASRSESKEFYLICKNFNKQYFGLPQQKELKQQSGGHASCDKVQQEKGKNQINKKGSLMIQFINKELDSIMVNNQCKKVNKKQLRKILDEYTKRE